MDINQNNTVRKVICLSTITLTALLSITPISLFAQTDEINNTIDNSVQLAPAITTENIDEVYRNMPSNSRWENQAVAKNFYQSPYQMSLFSPKHGEDSARLWSQTSSIFAYGFGVIGIIALLPEDISNWDSEQGIFSKWGDNAKEGPAWDRDTGMLNFVGHPYFGGVYYQAARKSGYRQWDSFLYGALMSTFYWEYGIESFAEIPSIQDLVITPVLGWAYGEWAFNTEMDILGQGGTVFGSESLGSVALFFLDPVDSMSVGINNLFGKEIIRAGTGFVSFNDVRVNDNGETENQVKLNISLQLGDGGNYSSKLTTRTHRYNDPVDISIIGISYGAGYTQLDNFWAVDDGATSEYSLGLYFTRDFSGRLTYSNAKLKQTNVASKIAYENYSLDGQYYFNATEDIRPYLTGGFGETLWNKDDEFKSFQVNAGAGIHYKVNRNFALQLDWRHFNSSSKNTSDNNISTRVVYFLGNGER